MLVQLIDFNRFFKKNLSYDIMSLMIDLHVHSTKSDGSLTPTELVKAAASLPLTTFALTDHDTMGGVDEAISAAKEATDRGTPVTVIPGVEISADYLIPYSNNSSEGIHKEIHIVGLYVNQNHPDFHEYTDNFHKVRDRRNIKMCEALSLDGYDISMDELISHFPDSVITRGHVARLMLEKKYVHSVKEAFERFIGDNCKYYIPREKISAENAISLIKKAGGIPVLAHPILYHLGSEQLDILVHFLKDAGIEAIEAKYCTYSSSDERKIKELAKKYELEISGGSDFHGEAKPGLMLGKGYGKLYIDDSVLSDMLKHLGRI